MATADVDPAGDRRSGSRRSTRSSSTTAASARSSCSDAVVERGAPRRRAPPRTTGRRRTSTRSRRTTRSRCPGDLELEHRIRSLIRWNAMAMVLQANKESSELGGHIASFQSAATLYEVGFNHFWHAPSEDHGGDLVYIQGHSSPGIYARAFLEGRLTEEQLRNFRQEVDGKGLSSYPHPWLMPDFWQFPTVSMGLGPIMAIYQARFMKYLQGRGLRRHRRAQGVGVHGRRRDGRAGVAGRDLAGRARAARQPDLRRQLQPAAPRRPGARQRQDHPGARDRLPRRGLERDQGDLGPALGPAARPPTATGCSCSAWRRPSTATTRPTRRATAPSCASTSSAATRSCARWSPTCPTTRSGALNRGGHDPHKVYAAYAAAARAHGPADGDPRQDDQGLRDGRGRRGPEHHPPAEEDDRGRAAARSATASTSRSPTSEVARAASTSRPRTARRCSYLRERRAALGGSLPARRRTAAPLEVPPLEAFDAPAQGHRRARDLDDDGVRADPHHARARQADRPPRRADRPRRVAHLRHGGDVPPARDLLPGRASSTSPRTATSSCSTARTRRARSSRRASTRPARSPRGSRPATSYANHGVPMIPFYIFYSMFGFQRIGDLAWAAGDSRARGFLLGGTAGRTTLNGEGLQHEDGHSHVLAATIPNCVAYDPTYALRARGDRPGRPAADVRRAGGRLLLPHGDERELRAPGHAGGRAEGHPARACTCCASGAEGDAARAAAGLGHDPARGDGRRRAAARRLRRRRRRLERHQLHRAAPRRASTPSAGTCCTRPRSRGASYVEQRLADRRRAGRRGDRLHARVRRPDPAVRAGAATACSAPTASAAATTASALRRFFEVDRHYVAVAALKALADDGAVEPATVQEAIERYGIDPDAPDRRPGSEEGRAMTERRGRPRPRHRRLRRRPGHRGAGRARATPSRPRTRSSRSSPTRRRWTSRRRSAASCRSCKVERRRHGLGGLAAADARDRRRRRPPARTARPRTAPRRRAAEGARRRAEAAAAAGDRRRRSSAEAEAPAGRATTPTAQAAEAPAARRAGPPRERRARVYASPARPPAGARARRRPRRACTGSGRKGRITKDDVEAAAAGARRADAPAKRARGRAGRATAPGSACCRGRRSTSRSSARSSACRCRASRRSAAATCTATG